MTNELSSVNEAIAALKQAKEKLKIYHDQQFEPLAIVGMSCRFPGANDVNEYWTLLSNGQDVITEIPKERWNNEAYYSKENSQPEQYNCAYGGFIERPFDFDSQFFSISPHEALRMDPQQRIFLEASWHALEDAGYAMSSLSGLNCGVYVGVINVDHHALVAKAVHQKALAHDTYDLMGNSHSILAARISYFLDLKGPSIALDTACSSSLVATHLACDSLRRHECDVALAGGVTLHLNPDRYIEMSRVNMLSADGHCHAFGAEANGFVPGEGVGVVVLKRLSDAQKNGDRIYAVIRGSALNQDGRTNGITAPNTLAQMDLIRSLYQHHQISPEQIGLVEAHGTGTVLGDPIEVEALSTVFSEQTAKKQFCALGSVKSNIGHTIAAAGIASLIKVALSIYHRKIPPTLYCTPVNPYIDFESTAFYLPQRIIDWNSEYAKMAVVSSFGFSGTNAHMALEEAPQAQERDLSVELPETHLLVLSAKTKSSLAELIRHYLAYLKDTKDSLADICYTAATGRSHFNYRIALMTTSKKELIEQLELVLIEEVVLVDEVVSSKNLASLQEAYCAGKSIDWSGYYAPYLKRLRKVSLPTYTFERQRYWLEQTKNKEVLQLPDDCFYELLWLEEHLSPTESRYTGTIWLFDNGVLTAVPEFGEQIRIQQQEPGVAATLETLPEDLFGVLYYAPKDEESDPLSYQQIHAQELLLLAQKLHHQNKSLPLGLTLITQHDVNSAPLGGIIKSLRWEDPSLNPRWIDVDEVNHEQLLHGILSPTQDLLSLRQGVWFSPTIQQALLGTQNNQFNIEGWHWITGGTGGLGLALAQHLIDKGVKKLLLTSRQGETEAIRRQLQDLREQDVLVDVRAADSAHRDAMQALIDEYGAELTGIYHLAGIEHSGHFTEVTPELLDEVLRAKIAGAALLDELTQSLSLSHLVFFSSIASLLGNYHQLAYSAANQYLDALAIRRRARNLPCVCINWGPWAEVGMAVRMNIQWGEEALLPLQAGFAAMERLIALDKNGLAVSKPQALLQRLTFLSDPKPKWFGRLLTLEEQAQETKKHSQLVTDLLALDASLRMSRLVALVGESIQTVLNLQEVPSVTKGFFELGLDSLMSVEVGRRLQEQLGVTLKPTAAFDYPSIDKLAEYLETTLTEQRRVITYNRNALSTDEPIAIIGMACRFPGGANSLEEFWTNLYEGMDAMSAVPEWRFDMNEYYDEDTSNTQKTHTKEFGFIDDLDLFDAEFFGISPREALLMDPQQRILLQTTWHALEQAGIEPKSLKGQRVGVFIGIQTSEYANFILAQSQENYGAYQATGNALSVAAGRIAYTLGTQGPTMSIDTACSSSLVALHEAFQALHSGECDLAIVAGVNSVLDPRTLISLSNAQMISVDGRCKTFDERANGYGRSEGCGVLVLQSKVQAMQAGAPIWAVLRASQVNQDGASSGLTVPNGVSQVQLLESCLAEAGLAPQDIDYIECHGTGTSLGDPIEVGAIAEVYSGREENRPLILGTVKTNIGHLESAAGVAGVIKTVLAMHHHYIPKHLHFHHLNPHINLEAIPAQIPVGGLDWLPQEGQPCRAAVSSFGFSGTNAHVILEEIAPEYVPHISPLLQTEFKKERYWLDRVAYPQPFGFNHETHAFLQMQIPLIPPQENSYYFESVINAHYPEFIPDHKIYDYPVIAGAVYLSTALQIAKDYLHWDYCQLKDVEFIEALVLPKGNELTRMYVRVIPRQATDAYDVVFYSLMHTQEESVLHARCGLVRAASLPHKAPLAEVRAQFPEHTDYDTAYHQHLAQTLSLSLGAHFCWCEAIFTHPKSQEALVTLRLPSEQEQEHYVAYPGFIDSCFQALLALYQEEIDTLMIPFAIESITWNMTSSLPRTAYLCQQEESIDYVLYDARGEAVAVIERFSAREAPKEALERIINKQKTRTEYFYQECWEPLEAPASQESSGYCLLGEVPADCPLRVDEQAEVVVFFVPERNAVTCVLQQVQELLREKPGAKQEWVFVTRCMTPVGNTPISLAPAGILGLMKSVLLEAPALRCRVLDVGSNDELTLGLASLQATDSSFVAVRGTNVYQLRVRTQIQSNQREGKLNLLPGEWQVRIKARGDFSGMELVAYTPPKALSDYEVEVAIQAVGLNFRDVLNVLGLYPGDAGDIGGDCAGVVTRIGKKVSRVRLGDEVFGFALGAFKTHALSHELLLAPKPQILSASQAAALPVAMISAYYGLSELANLRTGDRVLIHTAAGGVGLAAIALAKHLGCTIYATCSAPKQTYVRSLGVPYVYDSRSTDFAQNLLEDTQGAGVDVVLNTLTSEGFIAASLSCLRKDGCFIELSKRNIYSSEQMSEVRPDVAYHLIAIDRMLLEAPEKIAAMLMSLCALYETSELTPIPITIYPVARLPEAMRVMQQGKNIGKLVIELPRPVAEVLRADACYVITGGLGGLGLALCRWLSEQGAGHIALLARRAADEATSQQLQTLKAEVIVHQLELTDAKALRGALKAINQQHPIHGIFHLAGVLDDGIVVEQTTKRLNRVWAPKAEVAQSLHQLTQTLHLNEHLDYFILFSSMASSIGSPGQSNYAAANSYLDALAWVRRQMKFPALSIDWGSWAEVGMAASLTQRHEAQGIKAFSLKEGFALLAEAMMQECPVISVAAMDWKQLTHHGLSSSWLKELTGARQEGLLMSVLQEAPQEERAIVLQRHLERLVRDILKLPQETILNPEQGFFDFGMDSLMAMELKSKLQMQLGSSTTLSNTLTFDYGSIQALKDHLLEQLLFKERKVKRSTQVTTEDEAIAIIGMSAQFPGAANIDEFWQLLYEGRDGVSEIPKSRWDVDAYYDVNPETPGKMITRRGGFIQDIEQFDAAFFSISPKEATYLDPQQRLLLTHTWQALEDAGINPQNLKDSDAGVFIGISGHDYSDLINRNSAVQDINPYVGTGNAASTASGRISYLLGLEGPNLAVDTACSSSLVALNEACVRMRNAECSLAIVGGVNALLTPEIFINFSKAGMLSSDGACKTFDAAADGYVRGEGCGVLILKPLSQAQKDHDRILAVIKASGINQDGASTGLTVPNGPAQERLLTQVLHQANLAPEDIDYIECHGTGTSLGDPIEVHAIDAVYGKERQRPLYLGSVKSHIGHLESAAGIAGLVKTILALNHELLPAQLHFNKLNPHISIHFPGGVLAAEQPWVRHERPRRAAVSSFGFSGTNAHVILEEAPQATERDVQIELPKEQLFVLSAKSKHSLLELIKNYLDYLKETQESLADLCYTLSVGRSHFNHRLALKVSSKDELIQQLSASDLSISEVAVIDEVVRSDEMSTLANAYLSGKTIDWVAYYKPYVAALCKLNLPHYAFDSHRYWIEKGVRNPLGLGSTAHDLLGTRIPGPGQEKRFFNVLDLQTQSYLSAHQVFDWVLMPGAGFIETALASAKALGREFPLSVRHMLLRKPMRFSPHTPYEYQVLLNPATQGYAGEIHANQVGEDHWEEYASFHLGGDHTPVYEVVDIAAMKSELEALDLSDMYARFAQFGLHYGPEFQCLSEAWGSEGKVLVHVKAHEGVSTQGYLMHPTVLDGAFQGIALAVHGSGTYVPFKVNSLVCYQALGSSVWVEIELLQESESKLNARLAFYNEDGVVLAHIDGFQARAVTQRHLLDLFEGKHAPEAYVEGFDSYIVPEVSELETPVLYVGDVEDAPAHWVACDVETDWSGHHVLVSYKGDLDGLMLLAQRALQTPPASLSLMAPGAFVVDTESVNVTSRQAVGFWRSFVREVGTHFSCFMLDCTAAEVPDLMQLIAESRLPEPELVIRNKVAYVPRLLSELEALSRKHELSLPEPGQYLSCDLGIDTLHWDKRAAQELGEYDVRVGIRATALNFRDVLKAMNLYPGDAGHFGYECSGEVLAVGSKVSDLQPGMKIIAVGDGLFGSEVIVPRALVAPMPQGLSWAEGAALPIVFLTAQYALNDLAQLKKGQRVLIHAAAGGVGLAAIALARLAGAEVYVTASQAKQDYLRKELGVEYVYDSRSSAYGAQILNDTKGVGVDVVLNSLTSEGFIEASLSCLKKGGCFLELSKLNTYTKEQMSSVRPDVHYEIIAMDRRIQEEPLAIQQELVRVVHQFDEGHLQALPVQVFPVKDTIQAFFRMQKAEHIGKLLVCLPELFKYTSEGTYLITGGTGGLGFELAHYLIEQGVKHLVLTSRRQANEEVSEWMRKQQKQGVDVVHYAVDVADETALTKILSDVAKSSYPLKGVFHTAGVLHDGLLARLTRLDLHEVLEPKETGAKNLDKLTRKLSLDCFVLFSSMTSLFGSPGQSNYTAANAFLDGLAYQRRQQGLPAVSLNWGAFSGVGMAAHLTKQHEAQGVIALDAALAFARMDKLLAQAPVHAALMCIDWTKITATPYLSHQVVRQETAKEGSWLLLLHAAPETKREPILRSQLKQLLAEVMCIQEVSSIDDSKGFFEMGMDSLIAVDLMNRIQTHLGKQHQLSNTLLFDYSTIDALVIFLNDLLFPKLIEEEEHNLEDTDDILSEDYLNDLIKRAQESDEE